MNANKPSLLSSATGPDQTEAHTPPVGPSGGPSEAVVEEGGFVAFPKRALTEECRCLQGIPLALPIPDGSEFCPYLGERRGSFYDLLKQGELFRCKAAIDILGPRHGYEWATEWVPF